MAIYWTKERQNILKEYLKAGLDYYQIGKAMKKTPDAVKNATQRYDLKKYKTNKLGHALGLEDFEKLDDTKFEKAKAKAKTDWTLPKSKKISKKKKPFKTYLVTADHHIPDHNSASLRAIFKLMDDVEFDGNIILGDFMDMGPISHWNKNKKKTLESRRMKEDYIIGNSILDEYDKRLPKDCDKRYFWGNHEIWYNGLIEEMPALEGFLDPTIELNLAERNYTVYEKENHCEKIGKLAFVHGVYTSMHYVKQHVDKFKTNVIFGHLHSPRMRFESTDGHEISMAGYCLGCLCNKSPSYMKNRPNAWAHGFGIVYFYDDGKYFDVDLKRIVKGRFIYNNKLYNGNT